MICLDLSSQIHSSSSLGFPLTLSSLETRTDTAANRVDPDEMMSCLIRIYNICHLVFNFVGSAIFEMLEMPNFNNGRVNFRSSGVNGLNTNAMFINKT